MIFDTIGIDTTEVINAAATKWNFIKLSPGLVGGHCIGVDPYYLTFKAEEMGYKPNLILGARQINNGMGKFIAERTIKEMIASDVKIKNANVLILGLTFKENCPDLRNSKVFDIITELADYGCNIDAHDPWIKAHNIENTHFNFVDPKENRKKYHSIIISVAHDEFKKYTTSFFEELSANAPIIIDIKGIVQESTWRL